MSCRWFFLIVAVYALSGCGRWYDKDEAIRSLKVLNSDLANLLIKADELPEVKALKFIWDQPSAPVPFPKQKFVYDRPYESYNLSALKGKYLWDVSSESFIHTGISDSLSIFYTIPGVGEVCLLISEFLSVPVSSRPDFPIKINSSVWVDGKLKTTILHDASVTDQLPQKINTRIIGTNYDASIYFNRTRLNDAGTIETLLSLNFENSEILNFRFNATVGYGSLGYYFEKISFDANLFRHTITGKIDYDLINPTSDDYIASFNNNTRIEIFERPMKRKVGNIVLGSANHGELLDYHIQFKNKDLTLLSEYLPVINKILNVKL